MSVRLRASMKNVVLSFAIVFLMLLLPSYAATPTQFLVQATGSSTGPIAPTPGVITPTLPAAEWNLWLESHLTDFSPSVANILAENLGVNTLTKTGKIINQHVPTGTGPQAGQTHAKPAMPNGALNTPVFSLEYDTLVNPSISMNPASQQYGYAVYEEQFGHNCQVFYTLDAGSTWTYLGAPLPLDAGATACADPVVRYSPDGIRAYFVYLSVFSGYTNVDFLVDSCPPETPSTIVGCFTKTVLQAGSAGALTFDFPWVGVHEMNNAIVNMQGEPSQASYVYVTFTWFDSNGDNWIMETSNSNYGAAANWSPGLPSLWILTVSGSCASIATSCNPLVTGARVIGGMYNTTTGAGDVLACWYNSDTGASNGVTFDIQCNHSSDNGGFPTSTLDPWPFYNSPIVVAHNVKYALPMYLCPNSNYEYWWTGMFPSIAITPDGRAHVAFASSSYNPSGSPASIANKVDCGNIEYVRSSPFNYDHSVGSKHPSWPSGPVTVAGGGLAQGFPALVTQLEPALPPTSLGYRLYLFYYDAVNSPAGCSAPLATKCYANIRYDVYMRTSDNGGASFTSATRITDQSSLVNYNDVTGYLDASANSHSVWVIWPDRSSQLPCPYGVTGCPLTPSYGVGPIDQYDTYNTIYAQQVSVST